MTEWYNNITLRRNIIGDDETMPISKYIKEYELKTLRDCNYPYYNINELEVAIVTENMVYALRAVDIEPYNRNNSDGLKLNINKHFSIIVNPMIIEDIRVYAPGTHLVR
jgi:hypothetical protein